MIITTTILWGIIKPYFVNKILPLVIKGGTANWKDNKSLKPIFQKLYQVIPGSSLGGLINEKDFVDFCLNHKDKFLNIINESSPAPQKPATKKAATKKAPVKKTPAKKTAVAKKTSVKKATPASKEKKPAAKTTSQTQTKKKTSTAKTKPTAKKTSTKK